MHHVIIEIVKRLLEFGGVIGLVVGGYLGVYLWSPLENCPSGIPYSSSSPPPTCRSNYGGFTVTEQPLASVTYAVPTETQTAAVVLPALLGCALGALGGRAAHAGLRASGVKWPEWL